MESLLSNLALTMPAENIVLLFIISISFALFEKGKSALSPQRACAPVLSKGSPLK